MIKAPTANKTSIRNMFEFLSSLEMNDGSTMLRTIAGEEISHKRISENSGRLYLFYSSISDGSILCILCVLAVKRKV